MYFRDHNNKEKRRKYCNREATLPISHPELEFRAFSFINNIQYRKTIIDEWEKFNVRTKTQSLQGKIFACKINFKFDEIREWIEKKN